MSGLLSFQTPVYPRKAQPVDTDPTSAILNDVEVVRLSAYSATIRLVPRATWIAVVPPDSTVEVFACHVCKCPEGSGSPRNDSSFFQRHV